MNIRRRISGSPLVRWIKKLKRIVRDYDKDRNALLRTIQRAEDLIRDRTEINVDGSFHGDDRNQIIVVGRYRKMDYVQVYTLNDRDLDGLIDQLREMQRYGVVNKIDALFQMKEVIEREIQF